MNIVTASPSVERKHAPQRQQKNQKPKGLIRMLKAVSRKACFRTTLIIDILKIQNSVNVVG